jgi:hypothetical protein
MTDPRQFEIFLSLLPEKLIPNLWLIPIARNDKLPDVPSGESWKNPKFRLTPEQALARLEKGWNVGVVGLQGGLVIVDIEAWNVSRAVSIIPENYRTTLAVKTRSGGLHLYYLNGGVPNCNVRVDQLEDGYRTALPNFRCVCGRDLEGTVKRCPSCGKDLSTLMEIRADWRYVLAPGSYVPPEETGDGLYKVVAKIRPLPLQQSSWKFLGQGLPERGGNEGIKFGGKYLSLPCIRTFLTVPLTDWRKWHAAKLVAIAWYMDGGDKDLLRELATAYDRVHPGRGRWILSWGKWEAEKKVTWDHCGEAIFTFRANGMLPPCGLCPMRREADA